MPVPREFREWSLSERLPAEISPERARDIVLECFATVHGPHYAATKAHIGVSVDEATIRRSVKGTLRIAFKNAGGDFEHPDRDMLERVVRYLRDKSLSWGTPAHVVEKHQRDIARVLMRVPVQEG